MNIPQFTYLFLLLTLVACNSTEEIDSNPTPEKIMAAPVFGFDTSQYFMDSGQVEKDWTLSHLFLPHCISQVEVNEAAQKAMDADLNYIRPGNDYYFFKPKSDTGCRAPYCVYVKNRVNYFTFKFEDSITVVKHTKPVTTVRKELSGTIEQGSNLYNSIFASVPDHNVSNELIEDIESIYSWNIDFFRLHAGDQFKLVYEEQSVDDYPIGIKKIDAMLFHHLGHDYYSFRYDVDSIAGYYDDQAKSMKGMFLQSPVKYSRISSGFTMRRFHPVQKRYKAHLGTDYAAPRGTPIYATANGHVSKAAYSKYNGNYVKIKHNKTYSTQYLHMSKRASGMKPGVFVKQGQVIGYIGSTGLATGPHVCYRFWKNGKQVNHRSLKFQNSDPIKAEYLDDYTTLKDSLKIQLDAIAYPIQESDSTNQEDSLHQQPI